MNIKDTITVIGIVSIMSLFSNVLGTKAGIVDSIPGLLILGVIALLGMLASKYLPGGIPAAAYVVTLGCIITVPGFPGSDLINLYVKKVGFLALCTPILAYAGVAIGKDLDAFAKSGWRICLLAIVVFVGTYIASAIIAQAILKSLGQISLQVFCIFTHKLCRRWLWLPPFAFASRKEKIHILYFMLIEIIGKLEYNITIKPKEVLICPKF